MTESIRRHTDLGLRDAKRCTDLVLDGGTVTIEVPADSPRAYKLAEELTALGAIATAADDPA